jgi:hypothetical protein
MCCVFVLRSQNADASLDALRPEKECGHPLRVMGREFQGQVYENSITSLFAWPAACGLPLRRDSGAELRPCYGQICRPNCPHLLGEDR